MPMRARLPPRRRRRQFSEGRRQRPEGARYRPPTASSRRELAAEQKNLEEAKKTLAEQEAVELAGRAHAARRPLPAAGQERVQPYRDKVALHERNIEAIQKESPCVMPPAGLARMLPSTHD